MPRAPIAVPRYLHHQPSNRAYVRVGRRFKYLGIYGSPASREKYARFVHEHQAGSPVAAAVDGPTAPPPGLTVAGVLAAFWAYAKTAYPYDATYDGRRPPGEIGLYHDVMKPVLKLYAHTPAVDFGPKALKLVRAEMIAMDWCRNNINRQVVRVRTIFKWAMGEELIPPEVSYRLKGVAGLRRRAKGVRDTDEVRPVADDVLAATLAVMSSRHAAMVQLQLHTGMRSGNLCQMRTADVDTSRGANGTGAWIYRPRRHKTAHHGHKLSIRIGPLGRAVLAPYLRPDQPEAFVFSPAEEMAEVRAARTANRKTPMSCGNRPGSKPAKTAPRRRPRDHYTPDSYAGAVARACDRADAAAKVAAGIPADSPDRLVPHWHPHQLRHNKGKAVRVSHGLDGVLVTLGQKTAAMADRYAEIGAETAERVAAELG